MGLGQMLCEVVPAVRDSGSARVLGAAVERALPKLFLAWWKMVAFMSFPMLLSSESLSTTLKGAPMDFIVLLGDNNLLILEHKAFCQRFGRLRNPILASIADGALFPGSLSLANRREYNIGVHRLRSRMLECAL